MSHEVSAAVLHDLLLRERVPSFCPRCCQLEVAARPRLGERVRLERRGELSRPEAVLTTIE